MRLILVRHGQTAWNQAHRIQGGHSDVELDETGREQAEKVATALASPSIATIYSSPLKRAMNTAQPLARRCGLPVLTEPDLREIDAGAADGLPLAEVGEKHSQFWQEWLKGQGSLRFPGGESLEEVQVRAWKAVQGILQRHGDGTVVIVGHTFVLLSILLAALGLGLGWFRRLRLEPGSVTILEVSERGVSLLCLNDTCHWKGL